MRFPRIGSLNIVNESPGITKQVRGNVVQPPKDLRLNVDGEVLDEFKCEVEKLQELDFHIPKGINDFYQLLHKDSSGSYGGAFRICKNENNKCEYVLKIQYIIPTNTVYLNEIGVNSYFMEKILNFLINFNIMPFFPYYYGSFECQTNKKIEEALGKKNKIKSDYIVEQRVQGLFGLTTKKVTKKAEKLIYMIFQETGTDLHRVDFVSNDDMIKIYELITLMHKVKVIHNDMGFRNVFLKKINGEKIFNIGDYGLSIILDYNEYFNDIIKTTYETMKLQGITIFHDNLYDIIWMNKLYDYIDLIYEYIWYSQESVKDHIDGRVTTDSSNKNDQKLYDYILNIIKNDDIFTNISDYLENGKMNNTLNLDFIKNKEKIRYSKFIIGENPKLLRRYKGPLQHISILLMFYLNELEISSEDIQSNFKNKITKEKLLKFKLSYPEIYNNSDRLNKENLNLLFPNNINDTNKKKIELIKKLDIYTDYQILRISNILKN